MLRPTWGVIGVSWWQVFKQAGRDWYEDESPLLGAALAFYAIFSLSPLMVIAVAVAGWFAGTERVREELVQQSTSLMGKEGGSVIQMMLEAAQQPTDGLVASALGIGALIWGATGVFSQLQVAMNKIWDIAPSQGSTWWEIVRQRWLSFTMVLGTGFLLLISLILTSIVHAMGAWLSEKLPVPPIVLQQANLAVSLVVVTFLFALIFKFVPDVAVPWRDVWVGSLITAALFVVGKWALGLYIGQGALTTAYGAAGSLVVFLVWIYYSAQILFLGAEFTQVYSRQRSGIRRPSDVAGGRGAGSVSESPHAFQPPDG